MSVKLPYDGVQIRHEHPVHIMCLTLAKETKQDKRVFFNQEFCLRILAVLWHTCFNKHALHIATTEDFQLNIVAIERKGDIKVMHKILSFKFVILTFISLRVMFLDYQSFKQAAPFIW